MNVTRDDRDPVTVDALHFTARLARGSATLPAFMDWLEEALALSWDVPGVFLSGAGCSAGNAVRSGFSSDRVSMRRRLLSGNKMMILPSVVQHCRMPKCLRAAIKTSCLGFVRNSDAVIPVFLSELLAFHTEFRRL